MNDDNIESATPAASPRKRTAAVAAAVGVGGLLAGGLIAGAISAASADAGDSGERPGYGVQRDGYGARPPAGEGEGGPSGRMGGDCPTDGARGGGETGEGRPPAPPSEQDSAPPTEDSSYRES